MTPITISYSTDFGLKTIEINSDHHDIALVLEVCRKRIYPDVEPPKVDAIFDRIMKGRKHGKSER